MMSWRPAAQLLPNALDYNFFAVATTPHNAQNTADTVNFNTTTVGEAISFASPSSKKFSTEGGDSGGPVFYCDAFINPATLTRSCYLIGLIHAALAETLPGMLGLWKEHIEHIKYTLPLFFTYTTVINPKPAFKRNLASTSESESDYDFGEVESEIMDRELKQNNGSQEFNLWQ